MRFLILLVLCLSITCGVAQETALKSRKHIVISGGIALIPENTIVGHADISYFFLPRLAIDGDIYFSSGSRLITGGFKFLSKPYRSGKINLHTGATFGSLNGNFIIRIPVGLNFCWSSYFITSLGASALIAPGLSDSEFWPEIMIGFRF
jgi:hypothetical protein